MAKLAIVNGRVIDPASGHDGVAGVFIDGSRIVAIGATAPAGFSVNTVWEKVEVRHPEILASLKRLTGKDFGYDQGAWARWLTEQRAASKSKEAAPAGTGPDSIQWGK